jgi:hypothetical protein
MKSKKVQEDWREASGGPADHWLCLPAKSIRPLQLAPGPSNHNFLEPHKYVTPGAFSVVAEASRNLGKSGFKPKGTVQSLAFPLRLQDSSHPRVDCSILPA